MVQAGAVSLAPAVSGVLTAIFCVLATALLAF